ncbi:MAG: sulfatase [Lautropia sp.]|nr:sulfatase [Lautropia sp.]
MKLIFVLFDSLNRGSLECYGGQAVPTPNFLRLSRRAVTFDNHYVGSLPCMPARRDMHTGRLSFLHRAWGPLEPFDNSFAELLHREGVYSHLVSDHYHYWEDGGATYHNRYDTYEFIRGQERDPWKAMVSPPWERFREMYHGAQFSDKRRHKFAQYIVNRQFIGEYVDFPSVRCFDAGLDFLRQNRNADDWLLHVETFDPHEPFHAPKAFRDAFPTAYRGPVFDWPPYARVTEAPKECEELRANYCATVALCDHELGRLLDAMDAQRLWEDTALVVTTDHGFLLGEHDWWAKLVMPCYNEVAHIPLLIHHPDHRDQAGTRRSSLTQTTDIASTLLDVFGQLAPAENQGFSLLRLLARDEPLRTAALYGVFGSAVNITDGRHTYFRYPRDLLRHDLYQYTLMPTHLKEFFSVGELADATLAPPFAFSKGVPLLKVPATPKSPVYFGHGPGGQKDTATVLFDLDTDPRQLAPVSDAAVESRLLREMARLMASTDAPPESFERLDLAAVRST